MTEECKHPYVTNVREKRDSDNTVLGWWVDCQECGERDIYRRNEAWYNYLEAQRRTGSSGSTSYSSSKSSGGDGFCMLISLIIIGVPVLSFFITYWLTHDFVGAIIMAIAVPMLIILANKVLEVFDRK